MASRLRRWATRRRTSGESTSTDLDALATQLGVATLLLQLSQVDELVGHVPGEQLVAALAVKEHGDLFSGRTHDAPLRVGAGADEGLFLVPDELAQLVQELV